MEHRHAEFGDAGLCDRPRLAQHAPRATAREVVSKILYLRHRENVQRSRRHFDASFANVPTASGLLILVDIAKSQHGTQTLLRTSREATPRHKLHGVAVGPKEAIPEW